MHRNESGMATAELAVAMPAVLLVLLAGVGAVRVGLDQIRCTDAASVGARLAARGEPVATVREQVVSRAPGGATVKVTRAGGDIRVEVSAPTWGWLDDITGLRPHAVAVLPVEVPP